MVDDEKMTLLVMSRTLLRDGYDVFLASSAAEGLAILARKQVDMVISDHLLPDTNGLEFLKLVRNRHPGCIRVLLTDHPERASEAAFERSP
ncbi:MAG: response regulator [Myxococcaceae bacterium]